MVKEKNTGENTYSLQFIIKLNKRVDIRLIQVTVSGHYLSRPGLIDTAQTSLVNPREDGKYGQRNHEQQI